MNYKIVANTSWWTNDQKLIDSTLDLKREGDTKDLTEDRRETILSKTKFALLKDFHYPEFFRNQPSQHILWNLKHFHNTNVDGMHRTDILFSFL